MKFAIKSLALVTLLAFLTACSTPKTNSWVRLKQSQIDQKSYAVAYSTTAQSYSDRVNESYDIESFIRGVDDWYSLRISLPVEQIRASLFNRMLDHDVYAYYSGALYAAELQSNYRRLSPKCWEIVEPKSLTQGIFDAMIDLQRNKLRDDRDIEQGTEQMLERCLQKMENDSNTQPTSKQTKKS